MRIEEVVAHPNAVIAKRLDVVPVLNQGGPGQVLNRKDAKSKRVFHASLHEISISNSEYGYYTQYL
jgi:hypothetical protein